MREKPLHARGVLSRGTEQPQIIATVTKSTGNIGIVEVESNGEIMTVLFPCHEDSRHLMSANRIRGDEQEQRHVLTPYTI